MSLDPDGLFAPGRQGLWASRGRRSLASFVSLARSLMSSYVSQMSQRVSDRAAASPSWATISDPPAIRARPVWPVYTSLHGPGNVLYGLGWILLGTILVTRARTREPGELALAVSPNS